MKSNQIHSFEKKINFIYVIDKKMNATYVINEKTETVVDSFHYPELFYYRD